MSQQISPNRKSLLAKAAVAVLSMSAIAFNAYAPVSAASTAVPSNGNLSNHQTLIAQANLSGVALSTLQGKM